MCNIEQNFLTKIFMRQKNHLIFVKFVLCDGQTSVRNNTYLLYEYILMKQTF